MSTNKERLIAALQEPLETTLTFLSKTHFGWLKGRPSRRKPRPLWGKCHNPKDKRTIIKKIYESIINPFYCYSS